VKEYYDARAEEYDEWYLGTGLFADRERPEWNAAVERLREDLAALPPQRTLDVACGTGFLTRDLPGEVVGLDQSERMLAVASRQVPGAEFVRGDALALPFPARSFERVFTSHFYGHLEPRERTAFLREARRIAGELVVVDSALRPDHTAQEWQTRTLNDGRRFRVFKRYFVAQGLLRELGGGVTVHESDWFVGVRCTLASGEGSATDVRAL
jgi:demethylmenaquinone methyltransferase/2-methoxy-6-polyprenyl-1,4-benzoquinol methylase